MSSTMTDALLENVSNIASGDGSGKISNIMAGGQLGIGNHLAKIDASTPQVFTPAVVIVTHTPTMFKSITKADAILKALIERHAKSITGIDFMYSLDTSPVPAGHDGQELQMPTNSKRSAVSPSFVFDEIKGNLVWNFFKLWMHLIRHPDTHASALSALFNNQDFDPQIFSSFCMDICVIQFDPTMQPQNIMDSYFITNMFPTENGNAGFQREIANTQLQERTIPFTGVVQHNINTYRAGVAIADTLQLHKANYDLATPIATSIESKLSEMGNAEEIAEIAAEFKDIG